MAVPGSPLRILLAGACGLLLLGGIAGAAIVEEDDEGDTPAAFGVPAGPAESTTTTAAVVAGEVPPAPVPAAPGETAPTSAAAAPDTGATTSTTAARAGRAGGPGPLVAPKAGEYLYEATTTGAGGTRTDRSGTRVEAAGTEGSATLQAITIPLDLGGQQAVTRNTVAWSAAGGAVVRRSVITAAVLGQQQLDCVWQPPFPQYAGGLAVGKAWSFQTRCAGKVQGFDVTIEQRASRRVTGTASVAAPGGAVATWTIADDTTVVVTSPFGATSVRSVGTQQLAPSLGVPVRSESRIEGRMGTSPPQQSTVATRLVARP